MIHPQDAMKNNPVLIFNPEGQSALVVVCEHASCFIPDRFHDLGLNSDALHSHAAWDPGALAVAQGLSKRLDATMVASNVSRLVYDCNRPPTALDAMPEQSETISVPGNLDLTTEQRKERTRRYYDPFRAELARTIASKTAPIVVTVHSFTPIYYGQKRAVEIGVLHDSDARLAKAMMETATRHTKMQVKLNQPYGPEHGVTHTLKEHAICAGHLNVMLEIRNDLIQTAQEQDAMASSIADWLRDALSHLQENTQ